MRFLRCVHAELLLVSPHLARTRLGVALLALLGTLIWLQTRGLDPLTVSLEAGALGAIVGALFIAGGEQDQAALAVALSHPTSSLAIAAGRWVALFLPAAMLATAAAIATGHGAALGAAVLAAAAVGGCALATVLLLGNGAALTLFLFMAVAGTVPPERLIDLARPGLVRIAAASALELGPALWHYRDIVTGDWGAVAHAIAWAGLGVLLASAAIARAKP
jgi:hypothetical protein